jgi:hypothetical protein
LFLRYNVGISVAGGDALATEITEDASDLISVLRGAAMACKHALPIMRRQKSGVILMILRRRVGELSKRRLQGDESQYNRLCSAVGDPQR